MGEINWEGPKEANFGEINILYLGCGYSYTGVFICQFSKNIHLKWAQFIVFVP